MQTQLPHTGSVGDLTKHQHRTVSEPQPAGAREACPFMSKGSSLSGRVCTLTRPLGHTSTPSAALHNQHRNPVTLTVAHLQPPPHISQGWPSSAQGHPHESAHPRLRPLQPPAVCRQPCTSPGASDASAAGYSARWIAGAGRGACDWQAAAPIISCRWHSRRCNGVNYAQGQHRRSAAGTSDLWLCSGARSRTASAWRTP
jgi:hypothetical protein